MKQFVRALKGQAAMEFLMTYGWAILVVLVVIGALSYFGVLSPSTLLPEKCTFPVSVSCTDHSVLPVGLTLILQNGAGRDMIVRGVSASSEALGNDPVLGGSLGCSCNNTAQGGITMRNGASTTFSVINSPTNPCAGNPCAFRDTGRDKNRYFINLTYSWLDSPTVTHVLPGELLGRKP